MNVKNLVAKTSDELIAEWARDPQVVAMTEELGYEFPDVMARDYATQYVCGLITDAELNEVLKHKAVVKREWVKRGWWVLPSGQ